MDRLKQIVVIGPGMSGAQQVLGLREDGAVYRGFVIYENNGERAVIEWSRVTEKEPK